MAQFIEFATNHWELFAAILFTFCMLVFTELRKAGKTVTTAEATHMINKEDAVILDIRPKKEFNTGHIIASINVPHTELDKNLSTLRKHKEQPVIVVCNLGQTSTIITKRLNLDGFINVARLKGGITEWKAQNLPVVKK